MQLRRETTAHERRLVNLGSFHVDDKAAPFVLSLAFLCSGTARNRNGTRRGRVTQYVAPGKHLSKILYKIK